MRRLLRLLTLYRPFYGWMALGILVSLATLLANVTLMAVSGWFITSMAIAGAAQVSMNYFTPAAIIRGAAIVRTGGRYLERLVTHEATLRLLARLRTWFYARLEPLAPAALQKHHSGDLLSRIRADIDALDTLYLRLLVPAITAVLATLILTLYLSTYDASLALVLLLLMAGAGIGMPLLALRLGREPGRRKVELLAQQRSALVDGTQGLGELLLYGNRDNYLQRTAAISQALAREQAHLAGTSGMSQAALLFAANLALWLILWLAIPMVEQGSLPKADLAMLALFSLAAFEAVMPLPLAFQAYGETRAAAQRLFEVVDTEPLVQTTGGATDLPEDLDIVFQGVSFTYPGNSRAALRKVDLALPRGSRVSILGPSGSGKSSLLQLLVGFYAPDSGRILLGGRPLDHYDSEALRGCLSVVPQQTHLFTGTIRDNLLLARPEANQGQLEQACRQAQIHGFIAGLPDGYDTWVGEAGATLSGGQARRIAIARALLRDSPVLLLDEPTEGLDASTAAQLLEAIDHASRGKTVLLITHQAKHATVFGKKLILEKGMLTPGDMSLQSTAE